MPEPDARVRVVAAGELNWTAVSDMARWEVHMIRCQSCFCLVLFADVEKHDHAMHDGKTIPRVDAR